MAHDAGSRAPVQVLGVEHLLGVQQLAIEPFQRQLRRHHRVLDVEEAVVVGGQGTWLGDPALGPRIGRVDTDVDERARSSFC